MSGTKLKTGPKTIDEYIASRPENVRGALERVRSAMGKALPAASETVSYGIPAYKLHGRKVIYFAGWKKHVAIYGPAMSNVFAEFKEELARYEIGKGTIQFPISKRLPVGLIGRIARFRAKQAADRGR